MTAPCVPPLVRAAVVADCCCPFVMRGRLLAGPPSNEKDRTDDVELVRRERIADGEVAEGPPNLPLIYDVMQTESGKILFKTQHLQRIANSCRVSIDALLTDERMAVIDRVLHAYLHHPQVKECRAGAAPSCNIKFIAWPQETTLQGKKLGFPLHFLVFYIKSFFPPASWYTEGARVALLHNASRHAPNAKVVQAPLRERALALQEQLGVYETLLVNPAAQDFLIPEGSKSNYILLAPDGRLLCSEKSDILVGITLLSVTEALQRSGLGPLFHERLRLSHLLEAKSVIVLGTSPGTLPVREIVLYHDSESQGLFESALAHCGVRLDRYKNSLVEQDGGNRLCLRKEAQNEVVQTLLESYRNLALQSYD